jgi:rSAM/selenodomain-associated transferase 1
VSPALIVIAKAPVAGRVKTRLCPPCTPAQAAGLAEAALQDTLDAAARATRAGRLVIALDGTPGEWLPHGFEVIAQRGDGLAERLAAAFADVGEPAFLVGMDTPQLTPELLDFGLEAVADGDSAFGAALDGGYWGIGLRTPDPAVFAGVPMSSSRTGAVQRAQMALLGLHPRTLPPLTDVDTFADALAVAAEAPGTRFAERVATLMMLEGVAA